MNKKSISLKAIFIIWLLICYTFNFFSMLIENLEGMNLLTFLKEQSLDVLVCMVFSIIPTVINNFWILIIILIVKVSSKKVHKENLSEIDFKKYEGYYREILNEYSPAELEYVDNLECDEKCSIIATLLKLELLGKIKVNENNIEIIDSNIEGLRKTEKYILESIKYGIVKIGYSGYIESYAKDEGKEDNLIKEFEFSNKDDNVYRKILVIICLVTLFFILSENIELINGIRNEFIKGILGIGAFLVPIYVTFIHPISKFIYRLIKGSSYIRTDKGKELNEKIEGLKNYIIQYSSLESKEKEELVLWEDYLIYSVIFKLNTKIIEDMSKLIEVKYEVGKIYFSK